MYYMSCLCVPSHMPGFAVCEEVAGGRGGGGGVRGVFAGLNSVSQCLGLLPQNRKREYFCIFFLVFGSFKLTLF